MYDVPRFIDIVFIRRFLVFTIDSKFNPFI